MPSAHSGLIYVNGRIEDAGSAAISVFDHGFLYGDGVFDTMFARRGYVFKLQAHVERLYRSMAAIRLEIATTPAEMESAVLQTVRANRLSDAYIKVVVTRGVGPEPLMDPRGCKPAVIIFARPSLSLASASQQAHGLRVKITNIRRVPMHALEPRVKSLNYLNLVLAKIEALDAGCDEAFLADDDGYVCEAPGYNLFAMTSNAVVTPDRGVLEGITRQTVLELCDRLGIRSEVRRLAPYDLYVATDVFLTSTAAGLVPVVEIDGHKIGAGTPGQVFERLARAYEELLASGEFGTPV